jgi:transposase
MFVNATRRETEEASRRVVLVNSSGTSQACSRFGLIVKVEMSGYALRDCGFVIDRDLNAS